MNKQMRGFYGSLGVFIAIILVLGTLFFIEVPDKNNDIVKVIIGMLVSSLTMILYTIAGKDTNEVEILKHENEMLKEKNKSLTERVDHLEQMFMHLQERVIDKLSKISNENES